MHKQSGFLSFVASLKNPIRSDSLLKWSMHKTTYGLVTIFFFRTPCYDVQSNQSDFLSIHPIPFFLSVNTLRAKVVFFTPLWSVVCVQESEPRANSLNKARQRIVGFFHGISCECFVFWPFWLAEETRLCWVSRVDSWELWLRSQLVVYILFCWLLLLRKKHLHGSTVT